MSLWKDNQAKAAPSPQPEPREAIRPEAMPKPEPAPVATPNYSNAAPAAQTARKESLIAADLTIEGKIEGAGNVRIAGRFKGDVNVQGDLTIEAGAHVTGAVRADKVAIAGELEGNVESAAQVELQQGGAITGDVKAGSFTIAAGARMRGQAVFGWDDDKHGSGKTGKPASGV